MNGLRRILREHGRWLAVSFGIAIVVSAIIGYWLPFLYATINGAGAVIYLDGLDPRQKAERRRGRVVASLAAVLLPAGVFGVLASKSSGDPIDHVLGDEAIRNDVPGSNLYGHGNRHGGSH